MNFSRWSTRVWLYVSILVGLLGSTLGSRGAEPAAPALRWPEIDPALRNEEAFGLKFRLIRLKRGPAAARRFVEDELKRDPQPYVKAYLAWIGFFGPAWGLGPPTDYPRARAMAQEAIEGGSAVAQDVLGRATGFGLGAPADSAESVRLLRAASQRGSMWATGRLGYYAAVGYGVPRNLDQAEQLMRRAAQLGGITVEYFNLAACYENGTGGLPKDEAKAVECYYRAAFCDDGGGREKLNALDKQGVALARFYRALAYVHGANDQNWFTKARVREQVTVLEATGQDSAAAQYELGTIYADDQWVNHDFTKALAHLNRARGLGEDRANYTLARMRLLGHGMARELDSALSDLQLLSADGNPQAAAYLGYIYYWGNSEVKGIAKDAKKSYEFSRLGAENGSYSALLNLAFNYSDGIGVEKDYLIAAKLYFLAYERGMPGGLEKAQRLMSFVKLP